MVGWLHRLNGHEFEQAQGDGERQRSLACCSPWGCKESEMAEQLNNNLLMFLSTCPLLQNFYMTWLLPSRPGRSSLNSQGYSRCCLLGRSPKRFYQIEHNCQLLGCECFLSLQFLPIHPPIASGNHHSILCFFDFDQFRLLI